MQSVRTLRGIAVAASVCALASVIAASGRRLQRAPLPASGAEVVYVPEARHLKPLALGWHNVLADVLWFRTISYFGDHYETDRVYPWLARMCDLVTDLDPRAQHVYRFAGLILPWEADQVDEGIRLLEKGVQHLPDDWMLQYHLGMAYYFFRQDESKAAEHVGRAARLPGVHPVVARLAALLGAKQRGAETTLAFLNEMRSQADSDQMRDVLDRSITEAQAASDLERLDGVIATYRQRHGVLPDSLAALVAAGLLRGVPPDPFGGRYEIDPASGKARSSTGRVPLELHRSPLQERRARGEED